MDKRQKDILMSLSTLPCMNFTSVIGLKALCIVLTQNWPFADDTFDNDEHSEMWLLLAKFIWFSKI